MSVSQSILEILKTITIVIVFKISKMDCDSARCVSQVLHRCAQAVSRGAVRCASQVNHRGVHADAEAPRMYLIMVYRPFPAAPLVVRCMHVHGRGARTDACGRSFAVVSTQVSTVGLRLG